MALITPPIGASSLSGKVGGLNYARSTSGLVLRSSRKDSGSPSTSTAQQRAAFLRQLGRWRTLSPANRQAWAQAAQVVQLFDRLGRPYTPTACQYFAQFQMWRFLTGMGEQDQPTAPQVLPSIAIAISAASIGSAQLMVRVTHNAAGSFRHALYATATQPAGRAHLERRGFRFLELTTSQANLNEWSNYAAQWGTISAPMVGCQIKVRACAVATNGQHGPPVDAVVTWAA